VFRDQPQDLGVWALNDRPVGQPATDLTLRRLGGEGQVRLSDLWKGRPLVLLFGSYSCDVFDAQVTSVQKLYEEYRGRAEFLLVHVREAGHRDTPVGFLYGQDDGFHDAPAVRCERSARAADYLKVTIPAVIDLDDRRAELAYSAWPMRLVVVGRGGRVVLNASKATLTVRNLNQFGYWLKNYLAAEGHAS
jgi:hypothetical protein